MPAEKKTCQSCKKDFVIEPEDFDFYKKIDVPPPTWCPECRNIRRMAWRENRSLYRDFCALCKKPIITIHAPGGPFTTYCRECWWSDKWSPMDYAREYDFTKPFFKQYRELIEAVPRPALTGTSMVNSDYSHAGFNCKNCYFVFYSYFAQDSQYCDALLLSRNSYDSYTTDNSDQAYETIHSNRLYRSRFAYFADECLDSSFLYDCVGCSDCFGCVNLRKQKHVLFNEPLSKEEYYKRSAYWDLGSYSRLEEAKEKFRNLYLSLPHRYAHVINGNNVSGDIIRDAKDCQHCFSVLDAVQNCKYVYFGGLNLKDSYDVCAGGDLAEVLYETILVTRSQSVFLSAGGEGCSNVQYSDWPKNSSNLFGCMAVRNKKYCILNKQYSKEEYEAILPKIKKHMADMPYVDKQGRTYGYGEFFSAELSAYAYNESQAFIWYPKNKQDVLAEGWRWQESAERNYKITKRSEELPDHIKDADDSILNETIACMHDGKCNQECLTAFRLTPQELAFYRDMNVALPRLCPNCRFAERLNWRNRYQMHKRQCMCQGSGSKTTDGKFSYANVAEHVHGKAPCGDEFETTYSQEKPEMIYCEQCYKTEFL
jgi:hypothetical protein